MVVDAYRLLAHKAVVAAEYAAAVAVRLVGRRLLVAAICEGKGGSQIELECWHQIINEPIKPS